VIHPHAADDVRAVLGQELKVDRIVRVVHIFSGYVAFVGFRTF
jgi:hypothetical protein